MEDLSLHIHDIVENSLSAGADKIKIKIDEDIHNDVLLIEIIDNGAGMDEETLKHVMDPFYTSRTTRRVGLGIPLIAQSAKECNGDIKIVSDRGKGTTITATFQHSHIDRKPLGNIEKTLIVIITTNPDTDFIFEYVQQKRSYIMDSGKIKEELNDIAANRPEAIRIIKKNIKLWLNNMKHMIE